MRLAASKAHQFASDAFGFERAATIGGGMKKPTTVEQLKSDLPQLRADAEQTKRLAKENCVRTSRLYVKLDQLSEPTPIKAALK